MPLNYPKIELPDVEETIAFRAVDAILRGDPTLQRVARSWSSFRGDATDTAGPTPATCPYIQLAPRPGASKWETEGMHAMPFSIIIQAGVNGSNIDQIMNFWGFIRRALFPSDMDRMLATRGRMVDAGIVKPTITTPAYGYQLQPDGGRILVAAGNLNILLHINTP